jgi:hypothetical protein
MIQQPAVHSNEISLIGYSGVTIYCSKNWPAKEPVHAADITIPATNNAPPAIRMM